MSNQITAMTTDLITVAIPTRNRAGYLEYVLKSCAIQTSQNIQFLIVDNASTDSTSEVCRKYMFDSRFDYVFYSEHGSINEQFKRCYEHARGKWITIIGDDDSLYPDYSRMIDMFIANHGNQFQLLNWNCGSYRWPCYGKSERNRLSVSGLSKRRSEDINYTQGNTNVFYDNCINKSIKSIYHSPGVYHKLIKLDLVRQLISRYGFENVCFLSPDISLQVILSILGVPFLASPVPLTLAGYSQKSTGSSFGGNESKEIISNYHGENPLCQSTVLKYLGDFISSSNFFASEVSITYSIICHLVDVLGSSAKPKLGILCSDELANARKLAPSFRPAVKQQVLTMIDSRAELHCLRDKIGVFDSNEPSISLPVQEFIRPYTIDKNAPAEGGLSPTFSPEQPTRIDISIDLKRFGVSNCYEASQLAHYVFSYGLATWKLIPH
jgi:glycosyltransferase involved in cell wall biosynthesis